MFFLHLLHIHIHIIIPRFQKRTSGSLRISFFRYYFQPNLNLQLFLRKFCTIVSQRKPSNNCFVVCFCFKNIKYLVAFRSREVLLYQFNKRSNVQRRFFFKNLKNIDGIVQNIVCSGDLTDFKIMNNTGASEIKQLN